MSGAGNHIMELSGNNSKSVRGSTRDRHSSSGARERLTSASETSAAATAALMESQQYDLLTDVGKIREGHAVLHRQEQEVITDITQLIQKQGQISGKMQFLHKLVPTLQIVEADCRQLGSMVGCTSKLAEKISSKVKQLDLAKKRVAHCMQRVEDILDLKFCTDGVQDALETEDYEQAAAHIHRFLSLDQSILKLSADDVAEGSQLDSSLKLLNEAREKLTVIVHQEFDEAVKYEDVASIERFFKIFPLLKEKETGLRKFSNYLKTKIADQARQNLRAALSAPRDGNRANVIFADALTLLLEGIARTVDIHQPLVETYYGPGMLYVFMQHLQKECDIQSNLIVAEFKKARDFDSKVSRIQYLMVDRSHSEAGSSSQQGSGGTDVGRLEPKEIHSLLEEIKLLHARTDMYINFFRNRATSDLELLDDASEKLAEFYQFITQTGVSRLMQELIANYIMLEEYFMKESLVKAVSIDNSSSSGVGDILTSSMVDDVFYIIQKCLNRAITSKSIDGTCAMINHACSVLDTDYCDTLQARLKPGFPSGILDFSHHYNVIQSSIQQGKLQSSDLDKAKQVYLITLNNLDSSASNITTLKSHLDAEINDKLKHHLSSSEQIKAKIYTCLGDLDSVCTHMRQIQQGGLKHLHGNVIKPRIKIWIDTFTNISHDVTEEDFASFEANDPFIQSVVGNLEQLLTTFKTGLNQSNYEQLIGLVTTEMTLQLEKVVLKCKFNRLGGLQFDKELRSLVTYLTSITSWSIRDKFARLSQMSTVLNLERVSEILDYWGANSGPLTWRLTPTEVRQVLLLRQDFNDADVRALKL